MSLLRKLVSGPITVLVFILMTSSVAWQVNVAQDRGNECVRARARALASLRRAQRSFGRSRIAVFRLKEELRRARQEVLQPLPENSSLQLLIEVGADVPLEEIAQRTWQFAEETKRIGAWVVEEMDRRRPRKQPPSLLGPDIRTEQTPRATVSNSDNCTSLALYAEEGAFRAEQSAQLAEVATDQAIALANYQVTNFGP
jgi:hypothetical protein